MVNCGNQFFTVAVGSLDKQGKKAITIHLVTD
jgi:hypothetical protein